MISRRAILKSMTQGAAATVALTQLPLLAATNNSGSKKLLAGVAKKVITPSAANLAEYKKIDAHLNGDVAQDIFARIIVLGNESGEKLVLLSTDLNTVPRHNELAASISKKYGIDKNAIILSGTGNQQAVMLASQKPAVAKIEKEMMDVMVAGVGEAIANMKPAKMAFAKSASNINVHFGLNTPAGIANTPDFSKFADKELSLLRIDDLAGKTLALHVNYGMQSNMMQAASNKLSGDVAGNISGYIERRLGCLCAWSIGAAAEAYPLTTASFSTPVVDLNGKVTLEKQVLSEEITGKLSNYLTATQGMDIINANEKIARFSEIFSLRTGEQKFTLTGKKGALTHRLHLAVINEDIAFASANSITSAGLGRLVKEALPFRTAFLSSVGDVVGYVVDRKTDANGIAGLNSVVADAWQAEKMYVEGFQKLAAQASHTTVKG